MKRLRNHVVKMAFVAGAATVAITIILLLLPMIKTAFLSRRLFGLRHGDAASVPYARACLQSDRDLIRRAAARGLGLIGPSARVANSDLIDALQDEQWQVASEAAWSLGQTESPTPEVIDGLTAALDHSHREVRRYAAYSLSRYAGASQAAVPRLRQLLADDEMGYMAAVALGEIGSEAKPAISDLTRLTMDQNWAKRAEAIQALSKLVPLPVETVRAVQDKLHDDNEVVRHAAQQCLERIAGRQLE